MDAREPVVFVVDDDAGVLNALRILMRSVGLPVQTYSSAADFLEDFDKGAPGCLVLDVRMPGMSGMELQQKLAEMESSIPIIFITAHGDVPMAVEAVKAGAVDFIQKPFRDQELLDKIQNAIELDAIHRANQANLDEINARIDSLTPREREVMDLVVAGKLNKVIARELGISQRTVEIHRARVMQKMQVGTVSELVQLVMKARS